MKFVIDFKKSVLGACEFNPIGGYLQRQRFKSWWNLYNDTFRSKIGLVAEYFYSATIIIMFLWCSLGVIPRGLLSKTILLRNAEHHKTEFSNGRKVHKAENMAKKWFELTFAHVTLAQAQFFMFPLFLRLPEKGF